MGLFAVDNDTFQLKLLADVAVGQYASGLKMIPFFVLVVIWARLLTWVDKDVERAFLPRIPMNSGLISGLIFASILFFFLPNFFVAFGVFLLCLIAEVSTYLVLRKKKVGIDDLRKEFKQWLASIGRSKNKEVKVQAGAIAFFDQSGKGLAAPEPETPDRPGFDGLQTMLAEPFQKGADIVQLATTAEGAGIRYAVDGVSYEGFKLSSTEASGAVALIKRLAGLDVQERRKPQTGTMKASLGKDKKELSVLTRGSTAGESATIELDKKKRRLFTLAQTGMTDSQIKQVETVTAEPGGIILVATPKANGLRSLLYALARKHDAFLLHLQTIEHDPEDELEGITQNKLPNDPAPEEMLKLVSWTSSQEPDVLLVDQVDNSESAVELVKFAAKGKRLYVGVRAGSTIDALTIWRKLVKDDRLALKHLQLIIVQKLFRKLCSACKVEYPPDPETLRRLNMSPDKVGSLFQARTQPLRDPKGNPIRCEFCHDLRFKGRSGVFEMLGIDDEVREIVESGASSNQLKMQFKKQKQKYLQENAIAKAVDGDTSLQEVARILKAGDEGKPPTSTAAGRATPPSRSPVPSKPTKPKRAEA